MKSVNLLGSLCLVLFLCFSCALLESKKSEIIADKLYVVERERESLAIIGNNQEIGKVSELGNLNHATLKFKNEFAYVLARDGYLSKIDIHHAKLVKKVKIGKSGIGITFTDNQVIIVNYDPNSVVVLDLDLNVEKIIETNSRNVGVKVWKNFLVFSLMDKNEIWVLDIKQNFKLIKKFENAGNLPFDALINENVYVVGFFNEPSVGLLDLSQMQYSKIAFKDVADQLVYKVPHFGQWGVVGDNVFVPMVSSDKLLILDLKKLKPIGEVQLIGRPVFAAVSPDKKTLAVNFSGDQEDFISLVDTNSKKVMTSFKAGKRIMHLRFSSDSQLLYATSYFENKLHIFEMKTNKVKFSLPVSTPSGIFIEEDGRISR